MHDALPGHIGFSLSGKQVYPPKRFFPALTILSLSLSQKNKFTLQNVCSLPLGSLLTGQREESMVLCPTIWDSPQLFLSLKNKFTLQNDSSCP
jgi:hypothetical protein